MSQLIYEVVFPVPFKRARASQALVSLVRAHASAPARSSGPIRPSADFKRLRRDDAWPPRCLGCCVTSRFPILPQVAKRENSQGVHVGEPKLV